MKLIYVLLMSLALTGCISARPNPAKFQQPVASRLQKGAKDSTTSKRKEKPAQRMELPAPRECDYIIEYRDYTCSYNEERRIPEWVAYEITEEETSGPYTRKDKKFRKDSTLSKKQADYYDYSGSGWTRGHMAPAADFKFDDDSMWDTFNYTNICPQSGDLNLKKWEILEERVRGWADRFGCVYVVTGPVVIENRYGTIGLDKVVVPDAFFKAVLCKDGEQYHSVAFLMENSSSSPKYYNCVITVNALENITGINFFPLLDDSIEEDVEEELDYNLWNIHHDR